MSTETQVTVCDEGYQRWKEKALFTNDIYEARKAIEKAFFWMELRSAFIFLHIIEKTAKDSGTRDKLLSAKINLSKKLTEYTKKLLNETGYGK